MLRTIGTTIIVFGLMVGLVADVVRLIPQQKRAAYVPHMPVVIPFKLASVDVR